MSAVKKVLKVARAKGKPAAHSKDFKDSHTYSAKPTKATAKPKPIGPGGRYIP